MTATAKVFASLLLITALSLGVIAISPSAFAQRQEHMDVALEHLHRAREALEHAEHDKGGHREAAINLVDQAIRQVEEGKAYAREHPGH